MPCTPGGSTTPLLGLCKPAEGETGWTAAINGNWDLIDTLSGETGLPRSYLAGCGLTRSDSTLTRVTVAAGQCKGADQTSDMTLTTNITKDLAGSWVVGNNQNGLFAGTATQNTWYHVFLIGDLSVTPNIIDAGFDTSVAAANRPGAYSAYRRLGSVRTATNNTNIIGWKQRGDEFWLNAATIDANVTNPGTGAALRTLFSPVDVRCKAFGVLGLDRGATGVDTVAYASDPDTNDMTPSPTLAPLGQVMHPATGAAGDDEASWFETWTNTSSQIRTRLNASAADTIFRICTYGWLDRRGKDE